ncbi:MAG: sigma-54 dependent transcriptional regulator [Myxococcota bacterium]|nr:sigma-54 dependent transcriptional regulator [Myxococcota bacterium]
MKVAGSVLIVENEANMRRVLGTLLRREGYQILEAADGGEALEELARSHVDCVISDLKMPRMNGLELLAAMRRSHAAVPVILLTAFGSIESAVEALKQGAHDYLTKPFDPVEVKQVVAKAVRTRVLELAEASPSPGDDPTHLLSGSSPALQEVKRLIERVAPTNATVLVTGETGTGKELVARSVHASSQFHRGPFIKVNCAAIPESLFESELFGYERGAFTGAGTRKPGRFELAESGTLFLDEIGEMPLSTQPKLLRALQEASFFRVGGTRTIHVQLRLIAATNRDLGEAVARGSFRADLFYRLCVLPIHVPALRERRQDIETLAMLFLKRFSRHRGEDLTGIEPRTLEVLRAYDWPGNIRELENAIERAVLLCDAPELTLETLPEPLQRLETGLQNSCGKLRERVRRETARIERQAIIDALAATAGNVTHAAQRLGLSRRGLQLKLKEFQIER